MDDFSSLLNKQIKKAAAGAAPEAKAAAKAKPQVPVPQEEEPESETVAVVAAPVAPKTPQKAPKRAGKGTASRNTNRITVNLFEADSRALGVIRELLGSAGHDFSSRSDSIKIGLRLAAKAKPEELAKLLEQVRADDKRFTRAD